MYKRGCPVYCAYCAQPITYQQATVEHVMPKWAGGSNDRSNMLIVCSPCNLAKARDDLIHWIGHKSFRCLQKWYKLPPTLDGRPARPYNVGDES